METIVIIDYSPKAFAVIDSKESTHSDSYTMIGGKYAYRLKCGAAWIFSKKKHRESIDALLSCCDIAADEIDLQTAINRCYKPIDKQHKANPASSSANGNAPYILTDDERREWSSRFDDANYYYKNYPILVRLADGEIFPISKNPIETEFCFGYSDYGQGMTNDQANAAADNAKTNETHFIKSNMNELTDMLDVLQSSKNRNDCYLWLKTRDYKLWTLQQSYYCPDAPNVREVMNCGERRYYDAGWFKPLTDENRLRLITAYKLAYDLRLKRLKTYLKKYGLSKLRVWTYWADV